MSDRTDEALNEAGHKSAPEEASVPSFADFDIILAGIFGVVADEFDRPHGVKRAAIGTDDLGIRHFLVS